ncbi:MAG: very short patch repair endonuclease [Thiomicrospira sp.]|nr:MAG: very short patch repair endonuclease [Thiomicrospira sp.]
MTDTVNQQTRSKIMSQVKNKNTNIEIIVRKALFAKGFRYKINDKKLPGSPDIVLPKYRAVIFVNGCFWHGHHCPKGKPPKSNIKYWKDKIIKNQQRDEININQLLNQGWKVAIVWECTLKGKSAFPMKKILLTLENWLKVGSGKIEISI